MDRELANLLIEAELLNTNETVTRINGAQFTKLREELSKLFAFESEHRLAQLQAVVDAAPCTISWITSDLKYLGANRVLAEICQVEQEAFLGKPIGFYTNESVFRDFASRLFESDRERLVEELSTSLNGHAKWYYIVGRKYEAGAKAVMIGIDITEQKQIEFKIAEQQKLAQLGEMSGKIIHEIKNPLAGITGFSYMIRRLVEKDEIDKTELLHSVERIDWAVRRIIKIMDSIRGFAKKDGREGYETFGLVDVFKEAEIYWRERFRNRGIQLKIKNTPGTVYGNPIELAQVVSNLLNNGAEAIPENAREKWVKLEAFSDPDGIRIEISDSGTGIPEKIVPRLFEPFFTTKGEEEGTGLGLSICKNIVLQHGGELSFKSGTKNTFVIVLPHPQAKNRAA